MKGGSHVLSNDAGMARAAKPALQVLLGEAAVLTAVPPLMGSEDFHHLVIENGAHRYLYMYVGNARPEHVRKAHAEGKALPYANHDPDYQVELDAIPLGTKIGVASLLSFLAR